jgi:RNA-binding protein YlmH
MKEEALLEKRLLDLSSQSFGQGRYTFTNFLDLYEQSVFLSLKHQLGGTGWQLFGGYEGAERKMLRFGSAEELGYEQDYPMSLLRVSVQGGKFARKLSHRDYLGALMHLGIERNLIGDILVMDEEAYVFIKDSIGPFLMQEWMRVGKDIITIQEIPLQEFDYEPKWEEIKGFTPSFRADVMVGFFCRTSRKESSDLIKAQKVFLNGALVKSNSDLLKEGDILTVRGYGKAVFSEVTGQSKKGRYAVCMKKYI